MLKASFPALLIWIAAPGPAAAATYVHGDQNASAASIFDPDHASQPSSEMAGPVQPLVAPAKEDGAPAGRLFLSKETDDREGNGLPEPQSWMLMLVGLAVIGRAMRQKMRSFC